MEEKNAMVIRKPKYMKCFISETELTAEIGQMKQKYEKLYPNYRVDILIEPEPRFVVFDGISKEFICQAVITL
jgi:hypothetical protein